jgi:hypothetical protein
MDDLKKFLEESPIASRVTLPSIVVVRDLKLSYAAVKGIMENVGFEPSGSETCELEVGGQRIARGRIVRKRGEYFFKVTEMEKGGER